MRILLILSLLLLFVAGKAQETKDDNWHLFPPKGKVTPIETIKIPQTAFEASRSLIDVTPNNGVTTIKSLERNINPGTIKVNKNEELNRLVDKMGKAHNGPTVKIQGYRLQLIVSSKKATVDSEMTKLINYNSSLKPYTTWLQPNYRLRVGDYRTKLEAQKLQNDLKDLFPSAIVVGDLIELPRL